MVNIKFYGSLKRFGESFRLDVKTVSEAVQALINQQKGLRQYLTNGFFKVRVGKNKYLDSRYVEQEMLERLPENSTVYFTPVIGGAKKGGVFQVIAGAVLIVVGALTWWTGYGVYAVGMGVALMAGGVAQMLTKVPNMNNGTDRQDKKNSTGFSNIANMVAQGRSMALCYGRFRCGSLIISQGIRTYDAETAAAEKPAERIDGSLFVRKNR